MLVKAFKMAEHNGHPAGCSLYVGAALPPQKRVKYVANTVYL